VAPSHSSGVCLLSIHGQLIARIHTPLTNVRKLILQLLSDVGKEHPQALVYSVTVASKSNNAARKKAAMIVMDKMRLHSSALVEQVRFDNDEQ
jgi:FKBP12-rapamycin complex-associated protein